MVALRCSTVSCLEQLAAIEWAQAGRRAGHPNGSNSGLSSGEPDGLPFGAGESGEPAPTRSINQLLYCSSNNNNTGSMRYWAINVCSGPDVGVVLRFAGPDVSGIARPGLLDLIITPVI